MLRDIWVVFEQGPRARWALECAASIAQQVHGRLTLVHFGASGDADPVDLAGDMRRGLLGLDDDGRLRSYLTSLVVAVAPDADTRVRLFAGHAGPQLPDLLHWEQPELVVAATRGGRSIGRALFPDTGGVLLRHARCPVLLVRDRPPADAEPLLMACTAADRHAAAATGEMLADALGWQLALTVAPGTRRATALVVRSCEERRPRLLLVERDWLAGVLGTGGRWRARTLIDAVRCPVLFVPRAGAGQPSAPIVGEAPQGPLPMASSRLLTDTRPAAGARAHGAARRPTLLWQLFAANALVLFAATLVLILAPVSVSTRPVLAEAVVLTVGLVVMLTVHLLLLRRALAPLRLLTDVMGAVDPHYPGQRLHAEPSATAEVDALSDAFNAMLDRLEDERRASAQRALTAQEDERLRVAREMHDQVGQTLTALTIQAERAAAMEDPIDRDLLARIAQTALHGLDEVRRIARELRPEALDDLGLGNALIALCRRMSDRDGVRVVPRLEAAVSLRPEVELALYRIAQEAVTNAVRHARASRVDVVLDGDGAAARLLVRDDGRGMPESIAEDSAGLAGMRERALLIGGSLSLRSAPGEGTEVRLVVPLEQPRSR